MAVLLRHAARRLVGVQRTQAAAAVAEKQRSLLPRLVHTDERARMREALREIQEKKEELYDMISVTVNSVNANTYNSELLKSLSAQIEPRPDDPQWRLVRSYKRRSDVIRPAGIAMGIFIGFFAILVMRGMDAARAEEIAQAVINKEKQEVDAAKEKEVALL